MENGKLPKDKPSGLSFRLLKNPNEGPEKSDLLNRIKSLTREVRGNFDSAIDNIWFPKADLCTFFETKDKEVVAYSIAGWIEKGESAIIYSTIVKKEYQKKHLAVALNLSLIKTLYLSNKLKPFFCVTRTANPVVVGVMGKYLSAYPSPFRKVPYRQAVDIAKQAASTLFPENEFDLDAFVIKKAFGENKGLPKEFEKIPYYSAVINDFCNKRLQYEKKQGDAFLLVGRVNVWSFFRYFLKIFSSLIFGRHPKDKESLFWKSYFKVYDTLNESITYRGLLKEITAPLQLSNNEYILDLGCGTGNLRQTLKSEDVFYVGLDINDEALSRAKEKMIGQRKSYLVKCDIKSLCFKDSSFDYVLSNNVLYTLRKEDIPRALKAIYGIIKPQGGGFIASGLKEGFRPSAVYFDSVSREFKCSGALKALFHLIKTLPAACRLLYYNTVYIKRKKGRYTFLSKALIRDLFTANSFEIRQIKEVYAGQAILVIADKV